jgi:subtilisin family serine protease
MSMRSGKSYVIIASAEALRADLAANVNAAGGDLGAAMDGIGVAVATSSDPEFANKVGMTDGVLAVVEDVKLNFRPPLVSSEMENDMSVVAEAATTVGATETFRNVQWAPDAVHAPEAWGLGYEGDGARVAVLDGGIHRNHIDLRANLDVAHSASFYPGQPFDNDQLGNAQGNCLFNSNGTPRHDTFWHGTHVAGIIAAAADNVGIVGIAPKAKIIGVKVLHCGTGSFGSVIAGIYYAATPIAEGGGGANILNMSLGAVVQKGGPDIAHLLNALSRATKYANRRGATVIASVGNDALQLKGNVVTIPGQSSGVIGVSATAPRGFGANPLTDLDLPASYSNFGHQAVSFAAPGGDAALFGTPAGNAVCSRRRFPLTPTRFVAQFCWVFDMVFAPIRGPLAGLGSTDSYGWAAGTSMAAPAVAGVAALVIGKYGTINPKQLEEILRASADDLGAVGKDDFYGRGRVNAFKAVQ